MLTEFGEGSEKSIYTVSIEKALYRQETLDAIHRSKTREGLGIFTRLK
jgi:hypothetical protein